MLALHEHDRTGGMQHLPAMHMAWMVGQDCVLQEKVEPGMTALAQVVAVSKA